MRLAALLFAIVATAAHATDSGDNLFGTVKTQSEKIYLFDSGGSMLCPDGGMSVITEFPGTLSPNKNGCWSPSGDIIRIRYFDNTDQAIPRSAVELGPKYHKKFFL